MMIRRPTNLLFANTATFVATPGRRAATRKVRPRVSATVRKIGVIDYNAKAGLLFEVLERINRKQGRFTFYPVEAPMPMGLGVISGKIVEGFRKDGRKVSDEGATDLLENVIVDDFTPHLSAIRERIGVNTLVGIVAPMLAWTDSDNRFCWNYFSVGEGGEVMVSAYGMREYARQAGRPFEAAVAMLVVSEVWSQMFGIEHHRESRGCIFDFCRHREDIVDGLRMMRIDDSCLAAIPDDERDDVEKCLSAIRDYVR